MSDPLVEYLRGCCVQVMGVRPGCGFFIAPKLVVTCIHMLGRDVNEGTAVELRQWQDRKRRPLEPATVIGLAPDDDLALLQTVAANAAFAPLSGEANLKDPLVALGFPQRENREEFDQFSAEYEGRTEFLDASGRAGAESKFKKGQVEPGFSGGPLLNLRTGHVLGIVVATRDRRNDLGGWAIDFPTIKKLFEKRCIQLPAVDPNWLEAVARQQKHVSTISGINNVLRGISALPYDYANRVKNFLMEYLSTSERPIPFGGRNKYFSQLDDWLDIHDQPYLLLAAPAGRGKSALLVHWSQRLAERQDIDVVFFPVSTRFHSNLASVAFASIVARLAILHNEPLPEISNAPSEVLREMMANYLSKTLPDGNRLLLIIDGVDEAADWKPGPDLFPRSPPHGLRIIISARFSGSDVDGSGWLRLLGWDCPEFARLLHLSPLTPSGVSDVLQSMGFPLDQLGARVGIVNELHRLSGGDPLLVRLYVDDLWARKDEPARLRPEALNLIRPGLEGYFEKWWEDQCLLWGTDRPWQELGTRIVLSVLSCALGPLRREDLLHLAPPDAGLDTWTLKGHMRSLGRFVIGDGHQQGYVFNHPRLATYFYEQLTEEERKTWDGRYVAWGKMTLAALEEMRLSSDKVPHYLIQYYGAHLERAGAGPEELSYLVSNSWRLAWEKFEDFYSGFLNDVDRCWRAAEQNDSAALQAEGYAPFLGLEIKCVLVHSSVNSLARNISASLLTDLVEKKFLNPTQGLAFARRLPDLEERALALTTLVELKSLPKEAVLQYALEAAQAIIAPEARVKALVSLLPHLTDSSRENMLQQSIEAGQNIVAPEARVRALVSLLPHLTDSSRENMLQKAIEAVPIFDPEYPEARVKALVSFLPHLTDSSRENVLRQAIAAVPVFDPEARVRALVSLLPHLTRSSRENVLGQAIAAVPVFDPEYLEARVRALVCLLPHLSGQLQDDLMQEPLRAVCEIMDVWDRNQVWTDLVQCLPPYLLPNAVEAARVISDQTFRVHAFLTLVPRLSDNLKEDVIEEALAAARALGNEDTSPITIQAEDTDTDDKESNWDEENLTAWGQRDYRLKDRVEALSALIPHLSKDLKENVIEEALSGAHGISDESVRVEALLALIPELPLLIKQNVIRETLHAARRVRDDYFLKDMWKCLVPELSESLLSEVLEAALWVGDDFFQVCSLTALAPHIPKHQKCDTLCETLDVAKGIDDDFRKARLLMDAIPHLQGSLLREALNTAQRIRDSVSRGRVLACLIPRLPETMMREVLNATREIDNDFSRARLLATLVARLPEQMLREVLMIAREIKDDFSRACVLASLVLHMPQPPLCETLAAARAVGNAFAQARIFAKLAPRIPAFLLSETWEVTSTLADDPVKVRLLAHLLPYLPQNQRRQRIREALKAACRIEDEGSRAQALILLLPYLPLQTRNDMALEALAASRSINSNASRSEILTDLLPYLPTSSKEYALRNAMAIARSIADERTKVMAMLSLAPHIAGKLREEVVREALSILRRISDNDFITRAQIEDIPQLSAWQSPEAYGLWSKLILILPGLPRTTLYALWCDHLRFLSSRLREQVLSDLCFLPSVIVRLGGASATVQASRAVREICRWWP